MTCKPSLRAGIAGFLSLALAACAGGLPSLSAPDPASTPTAAAPAPARAPTARAMIAAADPRAVEAGLTMLREGGSATDAAIATMLVLGLVEPQSAGLGGGGFLLYYDARSERIGAYDGRERAPAGATPELFLDRRGRPLGMEAYAGGISIGTPSLTPMLKLAHDDHGKLAWARLFDPAIELAEQGFVVSPRLAGWLQRMDSRGRLRADIASRSYFYNAEGAPRAAGEVLRNPTYARTLRRIAAEGPSALSEGEIAQAIVRAAHAQPLPGALSLEDLHNYAPRRLEPVCGAFLAYRVCGMPSPSSGGVTVAEILGLYARARPAPGSANDAADWSAFLWASRLAYADRDHYAGDDEFIRMPTQELIAPAYLDQRASLIDVAHAPAGAVEPGLPAGQDVFDQWGRDPTQEGAGTTHLSVVDFDGNAVALTASVQAPFGAQRMVAGFMLNNQLTDFAFTPEVNGKPVANAPGAWRHPRSSMSPTIVTDRNGELALVAGSPGGSSIIAYVARVIVGTLDWNQPVQEAIDTANIVATGAPARVDMARMPAGVAPALEARGWALRDTDEFFEASGLHVIRVTRNRLEGGADPRREGAVGLLER